MQLLCVSTQRNVCWSFMGAEQVNIELQPKRLGQGPGQIAPSKFVLSYKISHVHKYVTSQPPTIFLSLLPQFEDTEGTILTRS